MNATLDGYLEDCAARAVDALAEVEPIKLDPAVLFAMIVLLETLLVRCDAAHRRRVA